MDNTQLLGIAAGILTSVSMIPQLIKLIREKKAEDVSLVMLITLLSGIALWIWYGFLIKDNPIIFTNVFSFLVNAMTLIMSLRYKKDV